MMTTYNTMHNTNISNASASPCSVVGCHHPSNVFDDYLQHCRKSCNRYSEWDRLLYATQQNDFQKVSDLLCQKNGVDPSYSNPMKQSALHIAARYGHVECLQILLYQLGERRKHHPAINAQNLLTGATPLHCALQQQQQHHSSLPQRTKKWSPSSPSAEEQLRRRRSLECVRLLMEAGADVSIPDFSGKTPLDYWKELRTIVV